jgi:hypothetical protein
MSAQSLSNRRAFEDLFNPPEQRSPLDALLGGARACVDFDLFKIRQALAPDNLHQKEVVEKVIAKDGNLILLHPVQGMLRTALAVLEGLAVAALAQRSLLVLPKKSKTECLRSYFLTDYCSFEKDPKGSIERVGADTVLYFSFPLRGEEGARRILAAKDARPFHRNFVAMTNSTVSATLIDIIPLIDAMTDGQHLLGNKTTFGARFMTVDGKLKNSQVLRALLSPYVYQVMGIK